MATELDLTPFGFTPTESQVYQALLERGPSGGYQLSNVLGIARANVYQALKGLVSKGAAALVSEEPSEYRAVRAEALFAQIADREGRRLDILAEQIEAKGQKGERSVVEISSERALIKIITRHAARTDSKVEMVGPQVLLSSLNPVWRKRRTDGSETELWSTDGGEAGQGDVLPPVRPLDPARVEEHYGAQVCLFSGPEIGIVVRLAEGAVRGYWSDDPSLVQTVGAAIAYLVS